jgi:hypothetical protein
MGPCVRSAGFVMVDWCKAGITPHDLKAVWAICDARVPPIPYTRICFVWCPGGLVDSHWEAHDMDDMVVPIACQCCDGNDWVEGAHE